MKRKQVNEFLVDQAKRRVVVFSFICTIMLVFFLAVAFLLLFNEKNKKHYVSYDEKSTIDYKVYLKENDFFGYNYLESNKEYIASLIDYITADFKYKLSLDEKNVSYKYSYRIEANVVVKHKGSSKVLYTSTDKLLNRVERQSDSQSVMIDETINIDYNNYNSLIKKFVSIYDLDNIESTLKINMYVDAVGSCEDFEKNSRNESVMTLNIPLTTDTVPIDVTNNLIDNENNVMLCESNDAGKWLFLGLGVVFGFIDILLIIVTVKYEIKTRTAETVYQKELKKILNNYSSYIQTMSNEFDFDGYKILKIDTFTDMLEVRDTIRQPILMKENEEKTGAYFVIPGNNNMLYVYRLKVSDIKKEIQKKNDYKKEV